jgi:hypothetical protein
MSNKSYIYQPPFVSRDLLPQEARSPAKASQSGTLGISTRAQRTVRVFSLGASGVTTTYYPAGRRGELLAPHLPLSLRHQLSLERSCLVSPKQRICCEWTDKVSQVFRTLCFLRREVVDTFKGWERVPVYYVGKTSGATYFWFHGIRPRCFCDGHFYDRLNGAFP